MRCERLVPRTSYDQRLNMNHCINSFDRKWVKRIMVLVIQGWRRPFEPNSCEFHIFMSAQEAMWLDGF